MGFYEFWPPARDHGIQACFVSKSTHKKKSFDVEDIENCSIISAKEAEHSTVLDAKKGGIKNRSLTTTMISIVEELLELKKEKT